jgi:hypothetical protein
MNDYLRIKPINPTVLINPNNSGNKQDIDIETKQDEENKTFKEILKKEMEKRHC